MAFGFFGGNRKIGGWEKTWFPPVVVHLDLTGRIPWNAAYSPFHLPGERAFFLKTRQEGPIPPNPSRGGEWVY